METSASENGIRKIDRIHKKVLVTKDFLIKGSQYGTAQFELYEKLKETYPGFSIEVAKLRHNIGKQTYANLTYKRMEDFMQGHETDPQKLLEVQAEYRELRELLAGKKGAYVQVKRWFLDKYKDELKRIRDEEESTKHAQITARLIYTPAAQ